MAKKTSKKKIEQYEHSDKERANNPYVGLVTPRSDPDTGEKKTYEYGPQLQCAGKAGIDEEKIESFKGTISLPFKSGSAVAVKIIDDRGIESLRVIHL